MTKPGDYTQNCIVSEIAMLRQIRKLTFPARPIRLKRSVHSAAACTEDICGPWCYTHRFESAKNGFPQRGHLNLINQFPAITAKTIHPKPAMKAGMAVPKSQIVNSASRNTNGTNPMNAKRLRFLR